MSDYFTRRDVPWASDTGLKFYGITEKEGKALRGGKPEMGHGRCGRERWWVDVLRPSRKAICMFIWLEDRMFDEGSERERKESERKA